MKRMNSAEDRLFFWKDPYDIAGSRGVFLEAVRENLCWHKSRCPGYRDILDHYGFSAGQITGEDDLWKIPVIPSLYFKRHRLYSIPWKKVRRTALSSGTGGIRSQVVYDFPSLVRGAAMVRTLLSWHGVFSPIPCHYLIMGYEPRPREKTGVVQTAFGATFAAPAVGRVYGMKLEKGEETYRWNIEEIEKLLFSYRGGRLPSAVPLRIVGFPAYIYFLAKELERRKIKLSLPASSCILMSGGWKTFWREEIGLEEFRQLIKRVFGIPESRIFEFYCSVEHNILYRRCPAGHFHVPVYSRVIVRQPDTLRPAADGEMGILSFVTPMMTGMPLLSIMTDDLAVMGRPETGTPCPCGCRTPYFDLAGRAGARDIVTCAAKAAERLMESAGAAEWAGGGNLRKEGRML